MTVQSTAVQTKAVSNGLATTFTYQFKLQQASDLVVQLIDLLGNVYGPLVLNSDYTVDPLGIGLDAGGNILNCTYLGAVVPNGWTVVMTRDMTLTQNTDLTNQGTYLPENVENEFDSIVMMEQGHDFQIMRSIRAALTDSAIATMPVASARANMFLAFDANGNPTVSAGTGTDVGLRTDLANTVDMTKGAQLVARVSQAVQTIAALRLISGTADGRVVDLDGYYSEGDGGGGQFYWNAASTAADNAATIIAPTGVPTGRWIRIFTGTLYPGWFGSYGDGQYVTDGAMNTGSAVLTSASNKFLSTDVGKAIIVNGAGAAGVPLVTTILSYQNAGQVTLNSANASGGNISAKKTFWAHDDTAAFNAMMTYAAATLTEGARIVVPRGMYYLGGVVNIQAAVVMEGDGTGANANATLSGVTTLVCGPAGQLSLKAATGQHTLVGLSMRRLLIHGWGVCPNPLLAQGIGYCDFELWMAGYTNIGFNVAGSVDGLFGSAHNKFRLYMDSSTPGVAINGAASITAGATALTVTGANFINSDMSAGGDINRIVYIKGAGPGAPLGADLRVRITAVTDATHCTVDMPALTTVVNANFEYRGAIGLYLNSDYGAAAGSGVTTNVIEHIVAYNSNSSEGVKIQGDNNVILMCYGFGGIGVHFGKSLFPGNGGTARQTFVGHVTATDVYADNQSYGNYIASVESQGAVWVETNAILQYNAIDQSTGTMYDTPKYSIKHDKEILAAAFLPALGAPVQGEDSSSTVVGWKLAHGSSQYISAALPVPYNWNTGKITGVTVFYFQDSTAAGNVDWQVNLNSARPDGAHVVNENSQTVTTGGTPVAGTQNFGNTLSVTFGTAVATVVGQLLNIQIGRLGGNASDTYAGNVIVVGVVVHFAGGVLHGGPTQYGAMGN